MGFVGRRDMEVEVDVWRLKSLWGLTILCWALVVILGKRDDFCYEGGGVGNDVVDGAETKVGNDGFRGDVVYGADGLIGEVWLWEDGGELK